MKYKIGDKVRVKEDLKVGTVYGDYYFNKEMAKLKGKVVEINDLGCNSYSIKEGRYSWTEEMFSGLAEPKNLIPLIAKELGVEMGEEFKVSDRPYAFKFTDDRLVSIEDDGGTYNANYTFLELISGNEKIIKLPKKPKLTEDEKAILRKVDRPWGMSKQELEQLQKEVSVLKSYKDRYELAIVPSEYIVSEKNIVRKYLLGGEEKTLTLKDMPDYLNMYASDCADKHQTILILKEEIAQLKSEQNKVAVEKLEEFKGKLREADEITISIGYLDKVDTFELLNEFIEELKGVNDERKTNG